MNAIDELEREQFKESVPALRSGDTVRVHAKVVEGTRERIQVFEGLVIRVTGGGLRRNFTVRRVAHSVGVERTFMIHSPRIDKIEVLRHGDAREFNRVGMTRARQLAMERAVAALGVPVEYLLLDAFDVPESPLPQLAVVKGDSTCASIMAASIVAKVHRDLQMIEFDRVYPGYGFALHKGYATEAHREAIRFLGPSPIHRTSWKRVRELVAGAPSSR